jgi:hypothetical protein
MPVPKITSAVEHCAISYYCKQQVPFASSEYQTQNRSASRTGADRTLKLSPIDTSRALQVAAKDGSFRRHNGPYCGKRKPSAFDPTRILIAKGRPQCFDISATSLTFASTSQNDLIALSYDSNLSALRGKDRAVIALLTMVGTATAQSKEAKWFVLRQETTGTCWTGLLIDMHRQYVHSSANLAGGPFDTKGQALSHEQKLEKVGTCSSGS